MGQPAVGQPAVNTEQLDEARADERELHLFDQHIVAQRLHKVAVDEILEQLVIFIQPVCIGGKEIRAAREQLVLCSIKAHAIVLKLKKMKW